MEEFLELQIKNYKEAASEINCIKMKCVVDGNNKMYWYNRGKHEMLLQLIYELENLLKILRSKKTEA